MHRNHFSKMVTVHEETNVEVLRAYTLWLQCEMKTLAREVNDLRNEKEAAKQDWLDNKFQDQLSRLQVKFFGRGREELNPSGRSVGHEKQQLLLHGKHTQDETDGEKEKRKLPKANFSFTYKMSERELNLESVAREISSGHEAWQEINGLRQEHYEITVHERIYQEVLHSQCKYKLKEKFNKSEKDVIVTAPGPAKVRPGSKYSIDFAVQVVSDKYEFHMPLERQRRQMQAAGLDIDVKTLYWLCEGVAEHCDAVAERIKQDILNGFSAAHVDESEWPIIGLKRKTYMWSVSNNVGAYFRFEPTRSGKVATDELLKDYEGSALTDGFSGYKRLGRKPGVRMGHCWSHVRREFFERKSSFPNECTEIIEMIDELFRIERKATNFENLRELRRTESKPLIKKIYKWLLATRPKFLKSSGLVSGIDYTLKLWSGLVVFLNDLSMPLSNNDVERALRHIVMGRKNFGGSKTIDGADVAANLYTVIESATRVGLQPKEYLKYLIDARWFGDEVKTPYQLSQEKLGPNKSVTFPAKSDWRIDD